MAEPATFRLLEDSVGRLPELPRVLLAEIVGTFGLVFFGAGAATVDAYTGGEVTRVGIGISFGLAVMAMVLAFARARRELPRPLRALTPLVASALLIGSFLLPALARRPLWLLIALGVHLLGVGWLGFAVHHELAWTSPQPGSAPARVTRFNLAIAVGGLLGGVVFGVFRGQIIPRAGPW